MKVVDVRMSVNNDVDTKELLSRILALDGVSCIIGLKNDGFGHLIEIIETHQLKRSPA